MTKKELLVENWNLKHPGEVRVRFWMGAREGEGRIGKTWSEAQLLSGHTPVVYVRDLDGKNHGAVALTHIEVLA
jgi:hypothetical protein